MTHRPDRRRFLAAALAGVAAPAVLAQERGLQPGERPVDPADLPLDRAGVWTLHFRYKPPRIMEVDGFDARGNPAKQVAWYLWYQVYNRSGEPVFFTPEFELVTRNPPGRFLDEPQPFIFDQIKRFEDRNISPERPTGDQNLMTTIQISRRPIPPSLPDAFPKLVSGLAIWTNMAERAPRVAQFSIFVSGLSNGVATQQAAPGAAEAQAVPPLVTRKTLRLDFIRPTDDNRPEPTDIRPDLANGPAETWVYRASGTVARRAAPPPVEPKKVD